MRENQDPVVRAAFGICIRRLRKRRGIAQERMASEAGIDRGYYGELERGEHSPSLDTVYRLLPHLKVSFEEFAREFEKSVRQYIREQRRSSS